MTKPLQHGQIFEYIQETEKNRKHSLEAPHDMSAGIVHPGRPKKFHLSVNYRPAYFAGAFADPKAEFGNCSQTIHAETANIFTYGHRVRGASMFLYPHCCPNCAKDMITAGVENIYIDARARQSHYAQIQAPKSAGVKNPFDQLTLPLLKAHGINVYEVDAQKKQIHVLAHFAKAVKPRLPEAWFYGDVARRGGLQNFKNELARRFAPTDDWSAAVIKTGRGKLRYMVTTEILPPGQTPNTLTNRLHGMKMGKFSAAIDSLSVMLMVMAREDLRLAEGLIVSNLPPYPRALFNATASGLRHMEILSDYAPDRLADRMEAVHALKDSRIVCFEMPARRHPEAALRA